MPEMSLDAQSLIDHQPGLVFFLWVLLAISAGNLLQLRHSPGRGLSNSQGIDGKAPRVSILVPARNESDHIEGCVRSLLAQDYPNFEVIVLDDHSQDGTGEIVVGLVDEQARSGNPDRLRLIEGRPLPPGWVGKNWACQQLGEVAEGDYLLFTDADTFHHPQGVTRSIQFTQEGCYDLLTALPHQIVQTWGEKLTVPTLYWSLFTFFPLWLAYWVPLPFLATGIGQYMLFRRAAYERAGGFAAVHDQGADDIALTRRVKTFRMRWRLVDGAELLSCRMYQDFSKAFQGFSRSFFPAFGYRVLPYLFIWLWIAVVFLEPPLILVLGVASRGVPAGSLRLAYLAVVQGLSLWGLLMGRFHFPIWIAFLYPVHISLALGMALNSIALHLRGQAAWKGRPVARPRLRLL